MNSVVNEIQTAQANDSKSDRQGGYDPSVKQKAAAKLSRIPVKVVRGVEKAGLDSRQGWQPQHAVL